MNEVIKFRTCCICEDGDKMKFRIEEENRLDFSLVLLIICDMSDQFHTRCGFPRR